MPDGANLTADTGAVETDGVGDQGAPKDESALNGPEDRKSLETLHVNLHWIGIRSVTVERFLPRLSERSRGFPQSKLSPRGCYKGSYSALHQSRSRDMDTEKSEKESKRITTLAKRERLVTTLLEYD